MGGKRFEAAYQREAERGREWVFAIGLSRRELMRSSLAGLAALVPLGAAAQRGAGQGSVRPQAERVLLRGGCVLTLDARLGDFDRADVLIEGATIAAVGPELEVSGDDVEVIDAANMIVMPGFIDTHRHMWQGALRNVSPDGLLSDYTREITGAFRAAFRPQDARIGDLVSALGALNAGVTTILDWSHIGNSPEHTDAAIEGLRAAGMRAVYAYGGGTGGPANRFPEDIRRLRTEHFSSADDLVTLAMAAGANPADWALAREVGAFVTVHVVGALGPVDDAMGPDVTYIHCTNLSDDAWRRIASTGGHVSIAAPIEMQMAHGVPPVQAALDHGIRPSLSVDVETQQPGDMFTQMRSVFALQRMLALEQRRLGDAGAPELLTVRDVVEFATVRGAVANQLEDRVGTLTPGKQADVILLRTDTINVLPVNDAYGAVVLGMDTSNVDTVLVAGRVRKRGGVLLDVDLEQVRREAEASRAHLLDAVGRSASRV
jgi:5-methylthioadenosine/S-adenosylhomocysteine deaminase